MTLFDSLCSAAAVTPCHARHCSMRSHASRRENSTILWGSVLGEGEARCRGRREGGGQRALATSPAACSTLVPAETVLPVLCYSWISSHTRCKHWWLQSHGGGIGNVCITSIQLHPPIRLHSLGTVEAQSSPCSVVMLRLQAAQIHHSIEIAVERKKYF